jgi:hypothetical protein
MHTPYHPLGHTRILEIGKAESPTIVRGINDITDPVGERLTPVDDLPAYPDAVPAKGFKIDADLPKPGIELLVFVVTVPLVFIV